jgi:23S rRNA (uracil1939-C5)-methyltransferase
MRLRIERLGGKGDGLASAPGEPGRVVPVPYALPGELVETEAGRLLEVIEPSPERIAPFCPHYTVCGGCRMQHCAPAPYAEWKRGLVEAALRHAGLASEVAPLVSAHGAGRRRATFHVVFEKGRPRVGFMAAGTHDLVELEACPVLVPALRSAPDMVRAIVRPLSGLGKPLDVQVTASLGGIDVDIRGAGKGAEAARLRLTELAAQHDLARLAIHGVPVVERRPPGLHMGKAVVVPPAGGFLQATEAGEAALAALVTAALGREKRVADLFCGVGPFALRMAEARAVDAFDADKPAIAALERALRNTPGLKPLKAEARDLFRRPLLAHEIKTYDALVLDPPRAGAEAQVREIIRARHPARIIYVSCDAGTFARDAAALVAAGWRLQRVTPVDQFAYTAHVEMVGVFAPPG